MGENCPWIVPAGQEAYEWVPIATLGDCLEDGPHPRSKAFREIQANAALIAAAPELLEACQGLLERYRIMVALDGPEAMFAARAIAKATGES